MHFVREIRLRRVKCLRAWVDLFYFTSEQSEDISQFAQANYFTSASADISLRKVQIFRYT